jgi:hypothetical protein
MTAGLKDLAAGKMSKADAQAFVAAARFALSESPENYSAIQVNGHGITADDLQGLVDKLKA